MQTTTNKCKIYFFGEKKLESFKLARMEFWESEIFLQNRSELIFTLRILQF